MNSVIEQWLILVLGYDSQRVIRSQQEGPVPIGDFAIYQIISNKSMTHSFEDYEASGDDLDVTVYNKKEVGVQIDVYASDGREKLDALIQSTYDLDARKILQGSQIVLLRSGSVLDLTALVDTKHKSRYQCDFYFSVWNTSITNDSKVNDYVITGKYQPNDEEVIIDTT